MEGIKKIICMGVVVVMFVAALPVTVFADNWKATGVENEFGLQQLKNGVGGNATGPQDGSGSKNGSQKSGGNNGGNKTGAQDGSGGGGYKTGPQDGSGGGKNCPLR